MKFKKLTNYVYKNIEDTKTLLIDKIKQYEYYDDDLKEEIEKFWIGIAKKIEAKTNLFYFRKNQDKFKKQFESFTKDKLYKTVLKQTGILLKTVQEEIKEMLKNSNLNKSLFVEHFGKDFCFDIQQLKVITDTSKILPIVAPAGSGKTSCFEYKAWELVKNHNESLNEMIFFAFTNSTKNELSDRIREIQKNIKSKGTANICTINSLASSVFLKFTKGIFNIINEAYIIAKVRRWLDKIEFYSKTDHIHKFWLVFSDTPNQNIFKKIFEEEYKYMRSEDIEEFLKNSLEKEDDNKNKSQQQTHFWKYKYNNLRKELWNNKTSIRRDELYDAENCEDVFIYLCNTLFEKKIEYEANPEFVHRNSYSGKRELVFSIKSQWDIMKKMMKFSKGDASFIDNNGSKIEAKLKKYPAILFEYNNKLNYIWFLEEANSNEVMKTYQKYIQDNLHQDVLKSINIIFINSSDKPKYAKTKLLKVLNLDEDFDAEEIYKKAYMLNKYDFTKNLEKLIVNFLNKIGQNDYEKTIDNLKSIGKQHCKSEIEIKLLHRFLETIFIPFIKFYDEDKKSNYFTYDEIIKKCNQLSPDKFKYCVKKIIDCNIKYIFVDEFQDLDINKINFIKNIYETFPEAKLLVVGDCNQAIFGYAGSQGDSLIKLSEYGFSKESIYKNNKNNEGFIRLNKVFRSNQSIINCAEKFINGKVYSISAKKELDSKKKANFIVEYNSLDDFDKKLELMFEHIYNETKEKFENKKLDILLVGRYNEDKKIFLSKTSLFEESKTGNIKIKNCKYANWNIEYMSIHGAKGKTKDITIILNNLDDVMGFPSKIENHRLIELMEKDGKARNEERQLFYVALTRAKMHNYFLVDKQSRSEFIEEISKYDEVDFI